MSKEKVGTKYYATIEPSGIPITEPTEGSGIYVLATASLSGGETKYNCAYKYKITATLNTPITDGTDEDIKIKFSGDGVTNGSIEYTLKQLIDAGTIGIDFTGTFENIKTGVDQTIKVESTVENTSNDQNVFSGNRYTINIEPYEGSEGFSCTVAPIPPKLETKLNNNELTSNVISYTLPSYGVYYAHVKDVKGAVETKKVNYDATLVNELIASGELWQSGLEDDGYRYVGGTTNICSYYDYNYAELINSDGVCPIVYNYTRLYKPTGVISKYKYQSKCPANDTENTYECEEVGFGTNDKDTCTSNANTYMYRIIGVFADEEGVNHLKLIKYSSLPSTMTWNYHSANIDWIASTLYNSLNGSTYLNNTTHIPSGWADKITNWKWTAANTLSGSLNSLEYNAVTISEMYLHEMNRSTKTNEIESWTTPSGKVGLMYSSDYTLPRSKSFEWKYI